MAIKQIKAKVGQTVDYKIIKDTYKTVTDRFVVSEDMDMVSTIDLNAPTESYTPTADYTISKLGEHKIITFNNDIVLPDDIVMEKDEYALIPYDGNVHYIPQDNVEGRWNDNFNRIGSVQIVGNTASNFSSNNYLTLQERFNPGNKPWEFVTKINLTSTTDGHFIGYIGSGLFRVSVWEGKVGIGMSTVTNDWDICDLASESTISTYVDYWVKAEFTGNAYNLYLSTDGIEYKLEASQESTSIVTFPETTCIGCGGWNSTNLKGSMDLSETYIKIDGEIWWKPECQNKIGWYSTIGSRGIIQDGIARNFNSTNYLTINNPGVVGQTYEVYGKFSFTSASGTHCIYEISNSSWTGFNIAIVGNTFRLWCASESSYGATLQPNTNYWFKCVCGTNGCVAYLSTDGKTYTETTSISNCEFTSWRSNYLYLGIRGYNQTEEFPGLALDLSEVHIIVDGVEILNGSDYNTIGYWNDEGIIKGFSLSNHMVMPSPFQPSSKPWEMVFKVKTGEDVTTYGSLTGANGNTFKHVFIAITNSKINVDLGANGTSWNIGSISGGNVLPNTDYLIKTEYTGNAYNLYYKTLDSEYELIGTIESSTPIYQNNLTQTIGINKWNSSNGDSPFLGYVDLNESYINIDGKNWWQGISQSNLQSANFRVIGTPTIDTNGVISNFSDYNYIQFPYVINDTTEIFTTFTTGSDISNMPNLITIFNSSNEGGGEIYINNNEFQTWNMSSQTNISLTTALPNTEYSARMKLNPSGRTITIYDAEGNVLKEHTENDSGAIFTNTSVINFGFLNSNNTSRHWKGSIDLTKTYVKINDEMKYLCEMNGKYLQGILDKETDATTLKLFANTLVMEKDAIVYPFEQPTMTSNGVMGNSNVACSSSKGVYNNMYPYYVFNNDNTIWHTDSSSSPWDIIYYSKEAIKPTKINIINRNTDPSYVYPATSLTVYGSTDGATYTQIGYTKNSVTVNAGKWSCDIETPMVVNYLKFVFTNNYNYFALTYIGIEGEIVKQSTHKGILLLAEDKNLQNNGLFVQYIGNVEIPTFEEDNEGSDEPESFFHNYYAWTTTTSGTSLPTTVYTLSTTPSVGDTIYDEHGEATTMTAIGVASDYSYINPGTQPAFFLPPEYYRDSEKDIMKNDSPGLPGNEDFEEGDDFEML